MSSMAIAGARRSARRVAPILLMGVAAVRPAAGMPPSDAEPAATRAVPGSPAITALLHLGLSTFRSRAADDPAAPPPSPADFHPTALDPGQWFASLRVGDVRTALVLAKDRDGWCLWPSTLGDWSIRRSPPGADVLARAQAACKAAGMEFGIAFSLVDQHVPADALAAATLAQLRELCGQLGPLDEVRLLGVDDPLAAGCDWNAVVALLRECEPRARIASARGPDLVVAADMPGSSEATADRPQTVEIPFRPSTSWRQSENEHVIDRDDLDRAWSAVVDRGATPTLLIPVDQRGLIPDPDRDRLRDFGASLDAIFAVDLAAGRPIERSDAGATPTVRVSLAERQPVSHVQVAFEEHERMPPGPLECRLLDGGRVVASRQGSALGSTRLFRLEPTMADAIEVVALAGQPTTVPALSAHCSPPSVRIAVEQVDGGVRCTLTSDIADAELRYTLDGRAPTPASPRYEAPLSFSAPTRLRAAAFRAGVRSRIDAIETVVPGGEASLRAPVQFIRAPDSGLRRLRRDGRFDTIDSLGAATGGDNEIVSAIGLPTPRPEGSYGLVFEGFVDVPADGLYTFGMRSDDASRLRIGDDVVIDHGDGASWEWWQGRIGLRAGWHPIRIEYTQLDGDQRLQLRWSGPGFAAESVPTARLAH